MLYGEKSREQLNEYAERLFKTVLTGRRDKRDLFDKAKQKFNMDAGIIDDMVTFRRNISEFTNFEIFCVVYCLKPNSLSKFFTNEEIEYLSTEKFETTSIEFPITFTDMVEVAPDQWIGRITIKKLMEMKRHRLINYEEGEQRALRRTKSGSLEIWKPYVSEKNVREIKDLMESGNYIPDPITLNMPDGSEYSFEDHTLTVYSLPKGMFNLDDGYHRYLAMSRICDFNPDFDYVMELRIVNFSNSKANAFIFQQDQKTPMKKVVSDSYDTNAVRNKIVARLNTDSESVLQGMLGRNQAIMNSGVLGCLIEYYYNLKTKKDVSMKTVMEVKNDLEKKFETLVNQDIDFLNSYTNERIFVTMFVFSSECNKKKYAEAIKAICNSLTPEEKRMTQVTSTGIVRKKGVNILTERIRELGYV